MKLNRKNPTILILVLLLLLVIPLTVWLALNPQLLRRRAAEDEVTVNLVPVTTEVGLAETFSLDVYLNTGALKVSGATITLQPDNPGVFTIQNIAFEADEQETAEKPFTHSIYNAQTDPHTFTVLAKRPDAQLPTGSIKVATITLQATGPGTGTIGINTGQSEIVGVKDASDIVNFTVVGTTATITSVGNLCRIDMCTTRDAISLVEQPRDDRKFNVQVSWEEPAETPTATTLFYKVYRGIGEALATPHPEENLVATTLLTSTLDTNNGTGFEGEQTIYYDVDTYIVCPSDAGQSDPTPTVTQTPTALSPTGQPQAPAEVLELSAESGTANAGQCSFTLGWDFSTYEDANPMITSQFTPTGGSPQAEQSVCSGVAACIFMGNPISQTVAPGTKRYSMKILNGQTVQSVQFTCNQP